MSKLTKISKKLHLFIQNPDIARVLESLQAHPHGKTLKLKASFCPYMKGINPHDESKGSNPSPGAHLGEISTCFKAHGYWSKAAVASLGAGRRQTDATPLLNNRLSNTANRRLE